MLGTTLLPFTTLLCLSGMAAAQASPPPAFTAEPIPGGCSAYPGYNAATGTAGPWIVQIVNSSNPALEGFGSTVDFVRGPQSIRFGYITFPGKDNRIAKTPLQCSSNSLQARVPTGVSGVTWQNLTLSVYPYDSPLLYQTGGPPVVPFQHTIAGVAQPGVFLGGGQNSTLWALKYYDASNIDGLPYYYARLLWPGVVLPGTNQTLDPAESTAFIKVYA